MTRGALAALFLVLSAASAQAAPPVINCPPAQSTYENGVVDFTVTASDPDGDPVTLSLVNLTPGTGKMPPGVRCPLEFMWSGSKPRTGSRPESSPSRGSVDRAPARI